MVFNSLAHHWISPPINRSIIMYSNSNSLDYQRFSGSSPSPPPPPLSEPPQVKSVSFSVEHGGAEDPEQGKSESFTLEPWPSGNEEAPALEPPPPTRSQKKIRDPWSTGLCNCFDDVSNCCITCWCPCITFGQVAEIIDKGSTSCGTSGAVYTVIACVTGCACFYSCFYRAKMRQQYMLKESPCSDCCIHCFCEHCALCQEYRELQNRGFQVPLGWQENVERDEGLAMPMTSSKAPEVEAEMSR